MNQPIVHQFIDRLGHAFAEDDDNAAAKVVESTNIGRMQEQYRAIAHGDFAAFLDTLADDISMEFVVRRMCRSPAAGEAATRRARPCENNFAQVEDQQPEIQSVVAEGDIVVVVAYERGRHRQSGRPYQVHWVQIFTFRDGKVARFRQICDSAVPFSTPTAVVVARSIPGSRSSSRRRTQNQVVVSGSRTGLDLVHSPTAKPDGCC